MWTWPNDISQWHSPNVKFSWELFHIHDFFKWYHKSNTVWYQLPYLAFNTIYHISSTIWYCSFGSKTKEVNRTVYTNGPVITCLDGSKICHTIFDLSMVTMPDKWLVVYRNQCQHSHRWYDDGQIVDHTLLVLNNPHSLTSHPNVTSDYFGISDSEMQINGE